MQAQWQVLYYSLSNASAIEIKLMLMNLYLNIDILVNRQPQLKNEIFIILYGWIGSENIARRHKSSFREMRIF